MERLKAQLRYRAKALLTALGITASVAAEYVIESPDTAAVIHSTVPKPWDQLLVLLVGALAVSAVHKVTMGPKPAAVASAGAVAESLPPTPPAPAASPAAAARSGASEPAPVEPAAATSLVTLVPFPRVGGGN